MADKLQISCTSLRAGDSFEIRDVGGSNVFNIEIVASDPQLLQAQDTSNVLPKSDEFKTAVERLSKAIQDISFVSSVTVTESVIEASFQDSFDLTTTSSIFNANFANGSKISFVRILKTDGTVLDQNSAAPEGLEFGGILVSNVTITSLTHEDINFSYPSKNYPYGNRGTQIKTTLDFTAADTFSSLEYKFGYVGNNVALYASPSNAGGGFKIDDTYFISEYDGSTQSYVGDSTTLNPNKPKSWVTGDVVLTSLGGFDYRIEHTYRLDKLVTFDDLNGLDIITPERLKGANSIKYVTEINLKTNIEDPNPTESTSKQDLTNFLGNGNVGYTDEVYKTGQDFYELDSITFDNSDNEINTAFDTFVQAEISTTLAGGFQTTSDLHLRIYEQNDDLDEKKTYLENINFEEVQVKLDGTPVNGTNLSSVTAEIQGGLCVLSFVVNQNTIDGTYTLEAELNDDNVTFNNQTITLRQGETVSLADDTTVMMMRYPDAGSSEYNFTYHYDPLVQSGINEVKSFIEDILINRFFIKDLRTDINTLNRLEISIRSSTNATILESLTLSPDQLPYTETRVFNVDENETAEYEISVIESTDGEYQFIYPFQIWQGWESVDNVIFSLKASFTQVLANGDEATFSNTWNSPVFEIGTYNETKNTSLEPQALLKDGYPIYIDEDTGNQINVIKNTGITEVVFQFEDNNLNDLQNLPNGPYPIIMTPDNSVIGSLTGYLGINTQTDNQSDYLRFHNLRVNPILINGVDNPWEALLGAGGYYAQLTVIDTKTAELRAFLNGDKLTALYGDIDCLKPSARLDKIALPVQEFVFITNFDIDVDGDFGIKVVGSLTDADALWLLDAGSMYNQKEMFIPIGSPLMGDELNGTQQPVRFRTEDYSTITEILQTGNLDTESLKIVGELDLSLFTNVTNVGFTNSPLMTSFIAPENDQVTTGIDISGNDLEAVDLSGFTKLAGSVIFENNPNALSLDLGGSTEVITNLRGGNCGFTGLLDVSANTGIQGFISFFSCDHSSISFPTITDPVTTFNMFLCPNLGASDFTFLKNYSGVFNVFGNPMMTSITLEPTSNNFTQYWIHDNGLTGSLDLSILTGTINNLRFQNNSVSSVDLTGLSINGNLQGGGNSISSLDLSVLNNPSGTFNFNSSSSLTSITWGSSTNIVDELEFRNCDITGAVDLSGYTNFVDTDIRFDNNNNLTSILLPTTVGTITSIIMNGCNLTSFDITPITGVSTTPSIGLANNNLNVANQEQVLTDLNATGWTGGDLNLNGNSGSVTLPNTDYTDLQNKGWNIIL